MLTEPIMHECIMRLLSQGDEESIECLSNLLKTMEGYFTQMQKILDKHSNNSKVRFKLQEVTDLTREVVAVSVSTSPEVPQSQADEQPLPPAAIVNSELLNTIHLPWGILSDNSPQSDISLVEQQSDSFSVSPTTENEDKENVDDQAQNKIKQSNKIKYNYKEDQWSPVNKEGNKRYDRNFLLQLQCVPMSLVKPQKLPNLDVIKDKPHVHKLGRPKLLPVLSIYRDHFWPSLPRRGVPRMKNRFPRKDENNPKAIKLTQKEAEPEAHEEQEKLQNVPFQKRVPHDQDRSKNIAESTEISEEGLMSSTKNISSCCIVDPEKPALSKLTDVDSIRLGPGRAMQSSSGGEIDCNSGSSPERAAAQTSEISEEDLMSSTKTESGNSNDDPNELKLTEKSSTEPSNTLHDMNTQAVAAQPEKYPSSGGMPTAQQHYQSMAGPVYNPQAATLAQQCQQMRANPMAMPQYAFTQQLSTVPSNTPHDMNKQVAAGQPGMYTNSGGMPTAQKHHQSMDKEKLKRSVQGILNKLTPQKFETLLTQVKNLNIDTEEKLCTVIDLIFEKAVDEPNFSVPYANMCKHLALIKVPTKNKNYVNFRKVLLTKCQKEFEQDRSDELKHEERVKALEETDPEKKKELEQEMYDEDKKVRYRQLGNIRFLGELFKLGMLTEPILHKCIKILISRGDEVSLECLSQLLKTTGKELDYRRVKGSRESMMDGYFTQMQNIVDKRLTGFRVRFVLQDVIDLKRNGWVPRREENNPKTIDQIHKEAEREAREQQQNLLNMLFQKRVPADSDRRKNTEHKLKGPEYNIDRMEIKARLLVDEFLDNNDFEEAIRCITELASPSTIHLFINAAINQVLERSSQARHSLGQLLFNLVKQNIITFDHYKKGFEVVLESIDEFALDFPMIWEYIGEILEPILEDNKFTLGVLKDVLKPCIPSQTAGLLVSATLHCAARRRVSNLFSCYPIFSLCFI
ncbi:eukaryotic translation initiation factor 4 gamma 1 isoform X2 [Parasteatoda tepidariorum]|uniref:eukaryotic translation initiation factor 4 gamma 1 isoform X2 n=2 Tax=Parasteatoda tepidariorum TaxID=114398 RepID=UPI0039BCB9C1